MRVRLSDDAGTARRIGFAGFAVSRVDDAWRYMPMCVPMNGDHIRAARTAAGLTQHELADRLGVRPITVYRWETGRRAPQGDLGRAVERWVADHAPNATTTPRLNVNRPAGGPARVGSPVPATPTA